MIGTSSQIKMDITLINTRFSTRVKHKVDESVVCQLIHTDNNITLHQSRLIEELLDDFGEEIQPIKIPKSPITTNTHIVRPDINGTDILTPEQQTRYQSGVVSLLYLIKHKRPDMSNSVRELTKAMDREGSTNYKQLLQVMICLQ